MLWIPIDRSLEAPLIRQVYQQIRKRILNGQLKANEKLPSTRNMVSALNVSRNVILEAYDQLAAEGFLIARGGSGTYVAQGAFLDKQQHTVNEQPNNWNEDKSENRDMIDFRSGIPALDLFPRKAWARLAYDTWNDTTSSVLGYDIPEGRPELRNVLSNYLMKTRGLSAIQIKLSLLLAPHRQ